MDEIVLDYVANGHVMGIEIDKDSNKVYFNRIIINKLRT